MSINQLALSLIKRNVAYRGPRTSDSWNDTIDEIATDLAAITSEWNSKLHPLLAAVPDGTDDVNVDAFLNGLDGTQLYTDSNATSTSDNGELWSTTYSRPLTVKETIDSIKDEVESNYNDLAALISDTAGVLTHDQKRAIGLEIFDEDYSFTGISILARSQTNEYNVNQLAKDLYGTASVLDGDGISHFGVGGSGASVNDALTNILAMHGGTWTTDISLVHDIVNADVNDNAAIIQTKLDNSGDGASDAFDIGVDPVNTLLDDLNVARTVIKLLKGTAIWTDDIGEPYVGAPVTLDGHINNLGGGTPSDTNPHGLNYDDLGGADLSNIRSVLGIDVLDTVPPYADFAPEGTTLRYFGVSDPVTQALAKLDDALDDLEVSYDAHAANTSNPHSVTAAQITAAAIIAEINGSSELLAWGSLNKTGSNIADLVTKSHTSLTDIGSNTHAQVDSALTTLGTENTNDLRTDVDGLLASTFLEEEDITYSFLDTTRGLVGQTSSTLAAGDDSRFGAPVAPLNHGNEAHSSEFIDVTHIQGSGSAPPSSGEHHAADIYVEDSVGNFSSNDAEQILAEIFGGSVKTLSADDIYARHTFSSGEDFTMTAIVNPDHQDLVVDDLKHTDIVAAAATDLQHDELIVNNVNAIDIEFPGSSDLSGFDIGETATQAVSGATGKVVYVDDVNDFITVSDFGTGTFDTTNLVSAPGSASIVPDVISAEYAAYAVDDTVTGTGGSGATGTIIYVDDAADTIWIAPTSGVFLDTDYVDNGDIGLAEIDTSGVTEDVDTYKPLDAITTDAGATAEVIETDISNTLIRVRDLVGTVTATDVVSNPRSPIEFTVQSSADREFSVGDSITGDTAGVATIEKIDVPNSTLRVLSSVDFIVSERVTYATNTQTVVDSLPSVTSSFHVGDIVTGSISTETGTITDVNGSVLSVGNASGTFNGSDVFTTNTPNDLGDSGFSGSVDQTPFDVTSTELIDNLNADLLDSQEGTYYLDRTNHSGTQAVSTLSDHNVGAHTALGLAALAGNNTWTKAQAVSTVALSDAATIVVDASLSNVFSVTLGGNRTLQNPTNLISGGTYIVHINQDGTGSRTLAYDTLYKFPGGSTPVLTTGINAKDTLTCIYDGTILRCAIQQDFS